MQESEIDDMKTYVQSYSGRRRRTFSLFVFECLVILTFFYPVATVFPSAIQIPCFILWVLVTLNKKKMWGKALQISGINILMFLVALVRCIAAGHFTMDYFSTLQVVIQRYQFMIFTILFVYVIQLDRLEKQYIFKLATGSIFVTLIFSLYYVICVDPQAIRNTQRAYLWGVGDFALMYAMALFSGPLFLLILEKKKRHERTIKYLILLGTMLATIVLCNLVTSIVVAGISIFVTYCVSRRQKIMYVVIGSGVLILVSLRRVIAQLLYGLAAKELFYWSTNNKIIAIANILMGIGGSSNVDTIASRLTLAGISISSFVKNPLFGMRWKNHVSGSIGAHMQWADDLARYGIIGNLLLIPNYIFLAKYTSKNVSNRVVHDAMVGAWITFFVIGFLNPNLSGTTLMTMFVVIPTFDSLIGNEREEKYS